MSMDEKVFISYSRKDNDWADKIKAVLEANGIPCWMDREGISIGEKYTREIISAIKQCDIFLLVLSPDAEQSEWVPKELGIAIQNRKYIIPVKIADFTVEEFELQLENIQIFEANRLSMEEMENGLVSTIRSVLRLNAEANDNAGAKPVNAANTQAGQLQKATPKSDPKKLIVPAVAAAIVLVVFFILLGKASRSPEEEGMAVTADATETEEKAEEPMDNGVVQELLGYVEQAEALVKQANAEVDEFADLEDFTEKTRKQTEVSKKLISDLEELQKQVEMIDCVDAKFEAAVEEYFHLTYDSQKALMEIRNFFADYNELFDNLVSVKPQIGDHDATEDYYNALSTWYQSVKEGYESIASCPSCLEPQWKKYGEILDLNDSISYKLYLANGYEDNLRYLSALNMSDRYDTVEEIQYGELVNGLQGESNHFRSQGAYSFALAEEIHAYAEMGAKKRGDYEFENIYTGKISLDYDAIDTIYPSLYNSYDAFLIVKTGCISGTRNILVEAEIEGLTQKYKESFNLDSAYKAIYIKPPALTGDLNLSSLKEAQISLTITEMDGTLIDAKTFPVTIKSKNDFDWYSDEYGVSTKDNILCFMAPESETIAQLKRQAITEISSMTDGRMESFIGYQNNVWDNHYVGTYLQAAGIIQAMHEMGVRYNMDPFSISGSNQHILFPDEVLKQKSGLCIETSLVMASALQSAGMHVFLVFPPGHAQVAVEVWNGTGNNTVGTGEYLLIETTALSDNWEEAFKEGMNSLMDYKGPRSGPVTYMNQEQWYAYITRENTYLIDCSDASALGMTPFAN